VDLIGVVVPARDEQVRIAGCLRALAVQTIAAGACELVVVLDPGRDLIGEVARQIAAELGIDLTLLRRAGAGVGSARRLGTGPARPRLLEVGRPAGSSAGPDAGSRPHRIPELGGDDVQARTSQRSDGRVPQGWPVDIGVGDWLARRRYRADEFDLGQLRACKRRRTVTVIVPTKECAGTVAGVLQRTVGPLAARGLVDELVVIDADSNDGTARIAADVGVHVIQQDDLVTEVGPTQGKGDAMWRALQITTGDVVCFLDGDTADPDPAHLRGLLGPLLTDPSISLVKGAFERPLDVGSVKLPHEGGRVTELMARPLLNRHEPRLAGFAQPLAGEFAARRDLLEAIPFPVGYGVEIGVLMDALSACGLEGLAECALGTRQNHHQPLRALGEMAYAVLAAVENRIARREGQATCATEPGLYVRPWEDGARAAVAIAERPPVRERGRHQDTAVATPVS